MPKKSPYFTQELLKGEVLRVCMDFEAAFTLQSGQKLEARDPHEIKYLAPDGDTVFHATAIDERTYEVHFHREVFTEPPAESKQ